MLHCSRSQYDIQTWQRVGSCSTCALGRPDVRKPDAVLIGLLREVAPVDKSILCGEVNSISVHEIRRRRSLRVAIGCRCT